MDYARELASYNAVSSSLVSSGEILTKINFYDANSRCFLLGSFARTRSSSSSSSGSSNAGPSSSHYIANESPYSAAARGFQSEQEEMVSGDEAEMADEVPLPVFVPPDSYSQANRPQSAMSSKRYRTPMASVLMSPPPVSKSVPLSQPMPQFETMSAYGEHTSSTYGTTAISYPGYTSQHSGSRSLSPERYSTQLPYRSAIQQSEYMGRPYALQSTMPPRMALERAIEGVQTHLAALTERIESLENRAQRSTSSLVSPSGVRSPRWLGGNRGVSPIGTSPGSYYTFEDMGMWSLLLNPLSAVLARVRNFTDFLLYSDNRSPALVIVRRLILDISFALCLLAITRRVWRRGDSRHEAVTHKFRRIWLPLVGQQVPRVLVDRGV
jgi:hypothetical protein